MVSPMRLIIVALHQADGTGESNETHRSDLEEMRGNRAAPKLLTDGYRVPGTQLV